MMNTVLIASHSYSAYSNIIKQLTPFLKKNGYNVVFIHINNISGKSKINIQENHEHFDFSLTNPKIFLDFIESKKPKVLICLEFTSLFIILLIRLIKHKNIKTIYFEHGIFIEGHGDKFLFINHKESIKRYLVLFNIYFKFGLILKMSLLKELKTIYNSFIKRDYSGLFDFGLFYAQNGYDAIKTKLSLPFTKTYFAGYPLASSDNDIELLKTSYNKNSNIVLLIHQPLIYDKLTSMDYDEEMEMFYEINNICNEKSLNLLIKLHPRVDINFYIGLDTQKSLSFTTDNFNNLLVKTKIIVGQFSTALFNGLILKIPIIIIPYKGLKPFYYKDFINFAFFSQDTSNLSIIIDEIKNKTQENNDNNSKNIDFVGKINSFENQANKIIEIIQSF